MSWCHTIHFGRLEYNSASAITFNEDSSVLRLNADLL